MDQRKAQRKEQLKLELAQTRELVMLRTEMLISELDFPSKIRRSITTHPLVWGAGAFLSSYMLVKFFSLFSGSKALPAPEAAHAAPQKSRAGSLVAFGSAIVVPFVRQWAIRMIQNRFLPHDSQH